MAKEDITGSGDKSSVPDPMDPLYDIIEVGLDARHAAQTDEEREAALAQTRPYFFLALRAALADLRTESDEDTAPSSIPVSEGPSGTNDPASE